MTRIICVGNAYVAADSAGPAVHSLLEGRHLPADVELIDGGVCGLDLLPRVEGAGRVVFVDRVCGFAPRDSVVVLRGEDAVEAVTEADSSHALGLAYLLRVLPHVCRGPLPEVFLVGVEGEGDSPAIRRAADVAVEVARSGGAFSSTPAECGRAS